MPLRKCTGCGKLLERENLIRVVRSADGIVIKGACHRDGRSAYICKNIECLKKAQKKKGLERSLRTQIPDGLYDEVLKRIEDEG